MILLALGEEIPTEMIITCNEDALWRQHLKGVSYVEVKYKISLLVLGQAFFCLYFVDLCNFQSSEISIYQFWGRKVAESSFPGLFFEGKWKTVLKKRKIISLAQFFEGKWKNGNF